LKILTILFIFIFLCPPSPLLGINEANNSIIYVDDDNTEGPWDGSIDHPFQFIQDGINEANKKDTILVNTGIYNEHLRINNDVYLIGKNKEETIVSANGSSEYLILDTVHDTQIYNFTFSCNTEERLDIIKMINCTSCTISNIDIISQSLQRSALIVNGSHNTIMNIYINGRFIYAGLEIFYSHENTIENNTIDSTGAGILIFRSHNNIIKSNMIINNTNGIYIEEGNQNRITLNSIQGNNRGLFSSYSIKNIIKNNNFIENDEQAKFTLLLRKDFIAPNYWENNYWDDFKGFFMKPIPGIVYIPNRHLIGFFLPWIAFDQDPSLEPFTINIL